MVPYEMLNDEQKNVIEEILKGSIEQDCIFLSGLAGTGKSEVIKHLQLKMTKMGIPYIVCGTTGSAAAQVGGVTIHHALGLTPTKISRGDYKGELIPAFMNSRFIYIDESSMLDQKVYRALRANMHSGQKIIFTGDLNQLPVVNKFKKNVSYEGLLKTMLFYVVGEEMKVFLLTKCVRQEGDTQFSDSLNRLALDGYFEGLNDIFRQADYIDDANEEACLRKIAKRLVFLGINQTDCPYIAATHEKCDQMNKLCLDELKKRKYPSKIYVAEEVSRRSLKGLSKENKSIIQAKIAEVPKEDEECFYLFEKVMITTNKTNRDTHMIEYSNGSIGYISSLEEDYIVVCMSGSQKSVRVDYCEVWESIIYTDEDGCEKEFLYRKVKKIPLAPGYAITGHRSQGMTVNEAYIDPQGSFEVGQVYTMLSRVKTRYGVHLVRPIRERDVRINPYSADFYRFVLEHKRGYNREELETFKTTFIVCGDGYLGLEDRQYLQAKEAAIKKYDEYFMISRALKRNGLDYYVWEVFFDFMFAENIRDIIDQMLMFNKVTPKKDPRLPSAIIEGIRQRDDHIISSWLAGEYDDILDKRKYGYPLLGLEEEFLKQAIKEFKGLEIEME